MDKDRFDLAIRLAAIEHMIIHVAKVAYLAAKMTPAGMSALHTKVRADLAEVTLPDRDPALSDHTTAEFAAAVDRFLGEIERDLTRVMKLPVWREAQR